MIRKYLSLIMILVFIISTTNHTVAQSNDVSDPVKNIALIDDTINKGLFPPSPEPINIVVGESLADKEAREKREAEEAERKRQEEERQRQAIAYQQQLARRKPVIRPATVAPAQTTQAVQVAPTNNANLCSCVDYVQAVTGIRIGVIGFARNWPINSREPRIGSVVITSESAAGHVARIIGIEGDDLILDEANYSRCRKTTGRRLNKRSGLIRGYFNP